MPNCIISVVVPAYNEKRTLANVIQKLLSIPGLLEIIVVDDCSTDGTLEIASSLANEHEQVRTLRHEQQSGKTSALRTGFAVTRGEIVIVQDADLEYDPSEIKDVVQPIIDGV